MQKNNEIENEENPQGVDVGDVVKIAGKVSNWKTYALYFLLAVTVVQSMAIIWQRGTVAKAKLDVEKLDKKLQRAYLERDIAKENDASCRVNLTDQNEKIEKAGEEYEKLKSDFDKLKDDIKKGKYYREADNIRNKPTPKTCSEALDFLNSAFP